MKTQFIYQLCFCLSILCFAACSTEDDSNPNDPSNSIIVVNIAEYPTSGDLITTINSSLTGTLSYSISFETASQAAIINEDELRVGDWLAFDYETNPSLFVTVDVNNDTTTETLEYRIDITNVDDIWAFLNGDSRTAYENASIGDWVQIVESEYNDLSNYLSDTSKVGASDDQLDNNNAINYDLEYYVFSNDNGMTIPSNSYLFAVKYNGGQFRPINSKVKISNTTTEGYIDLGNSLPDHDSGDNYFVIKGNSIQTNTASYLAIAANSMGYNNSSQHVFNFSASNPTTEEEESTLIYDRDGLALYQGLSTTLKQWD